MRARAIYNALKFGLLPYWCYEKEKHYDCSYWLHLRINLQYAFRWLTFREDPTDIDFELSTNNNA